MSIVFKERNMNDSVADSKMADAIRILSIDAVTNAKSGHPGMPLGASQIIFTIFKYHLRFNPKEPKWFFRDRFVLSSGHASAMLYSTLYLFGYDINIDDLKSFRKLGSKTPGHPEYGLTPGVEATTGPLGQGISMAVGMAWSAKYLASLFNKKDITLLDNFIYVIAGDGDMMEGISYEAASLAGHMKLDNLICVYDSNRTTIEGKTDITFSEDVKKRFESCGWSVRIVNDGFDIDKLNQAISEAKKEIGKPKLIIAKTEIGYKSPKEGSNKVHGEPLTEGEVTLTRKNLGWEWQERFYIPDEIISAFKKIVENKIKQKKDLDIKLENYRKKYRDDWDKLSKYLNKDLINIDLSIEESQSLSTRESSHLILNQIAKKVENIISGSADLSPSTKTNIIDFPQRNIHFGIREHSMGAFVNGVSLFGGIRPVCSTFLVFSDYMRPALRLSSIMKISPIFVFTHDSIGVGEDGPTHQPVEHIMSLRLIPDFTVIRPADFYETLSAWKFILNFNSPSALILTRQRVNTLSEYRDIIVTNFSKGGYILTSHRSPDVVLIASGSEVHIAIETSKILMNSNIKANVVSIPSVELLKKNDRDYLQTLFPSKLKKYVIEAGVGSGWSDIVGDKVEFFGVNTFGYSGNEKDVYKKFGLVPDEIAEKIVEKL